MNGAAGRRSGACANEKGFPVPVSVYGMCLQQKNASLQSAMEREIWKERNAAVHADAVAVAVADDADDEKEGVRTADRM